MRIPDHQRLTRSFFRGVTSPHLFRRFFDSFGVWDRMELDDEAKADAIFRAWEGLTGVDRDEMDEALYRINDLSHPKARFAVLYRAKDCGVEGCDDMTPEERALTLFLDRRDDFEATYEFHTIEKTDSLRVLVGRHPVPCADTQENLDRFKVKLSKALQREAHGRHLLIERARDHQKKWMAAIPHQTFAKADHEFDEQHEGEILTRPRRPIYEMILIYYPARALLKLKVGRGLRKLQRVAQCFATEMLGQDSDFFRIKDVVSFAPLRNPHFAFTRDPGDKFKSVRATKIRYRTVAHGDFEHTLQCKNHSPEAPDVLDWLSHEGINRADIVVNSLTLRFQFPGGPRDTRTVEIGTPNESSLDETERDRYIEKILARYGFLDIAAKELMAGAGVS
ncbi:MAG: hypothetical protein AB7T63_04085 [Planctomycetota bacterium]